MGPFGCSTSDAPCSCPTTTTSSPEHRGLEVTGLACMDGPHLGPGLLEQHKSPVPVRLGSVEHGPWRARPSGLSGAGCNLMRSHWLSTPPIVGTFGCHRCSKRRPPLILAPLELSSKLPAIHQQLSGLWSIELCHHDTPHPELHHSPKPLQRDRLRLLTMLACQGRHFWLGIAPPVSLHQGP